MINTQNKAYN